MLDIMYEVPSDPTIEKVIITRGCVDKKTKPEYVKNPNRKPIRRSNKTENIHDTNHFNVS